MDIAALSVSMAQANVQSAVGVSLLKMANEAAKQQGEQLVQMMMQSVQPHLGKATLIFECNGKGLFHKQVP